MKKLFLLLATVAIAAVSLLPAAPETASHEELAERLMILMNRRDVILAAFTATTDPVLEQMPESKRPEIRKLFREFGEKIADAPELKTRMKALYAETFSEKEILDLLAFYETPSGRKALEKMPVLLQKGSAIGEELARKHQAQLQQDLQKILQDSDEN